MQIIYYFFTGWFFIPSPTALRQPLPQSERGDLRNNNGFKSMLDIGADGFAFFRQVN